MKMNIHYYILAAAVAAGSAAGAQAQNVAKQDTTMNKVMVIENEYIPQISDAEKINLVPEVKSPQVTPKKVEYAVSSSPSNNIPAETMNPMIGRELQPEATKGYVRLGFGNYGNIDVLGNYLLTIGKRDRVNFNVQAEGMSGKLKCFDGANEYKSKIKHYRIGGGVDYLHQFDNIDMNIAAESGVTKLSYPKAFDTADQRLATGNLLFGLKSTDDDADFSWKASTNYIYYKRRDLLLSGVNDVENRLRTMGKVSGKIAEGQKVTVAAEMNNVIFNNGDLFSDYTTVDLNPYYSYVDDSWMLRVGANVDFSLGFGKKLQASPDININYIFADSYVLYLNATGGRRLNDFRMAEIANPYSLITSTLTNSYEQLNGEIGVKGSPISGLHFNVRGGYQKLKDDLFSDLSDATVKVGPTYFYNADTYNAFAGLDLSYDYRSKVAASASILYRNWDMSKKDEASSLRPLLFHPELELNMALTVRPIEKLMVELAYRYEKRKKIESYDIKPVSDLRLHAEYNFYKGISIYANVNNILNKRYQYYYNIPTEGFNFLGGLSFKF